MHVLNLKHNKSHSNFVWFFHYSVYHKNSKKYLSNSYTTAVCFQENCCTAPPAEHPCVSRGSWGQLLPCTSATSGALFSNWILLSSGSRTCCKEGHQGSKSQTSKKHKSQAFDFRDLFHVVSHNTQIGVVIHIRVIHGSNPQQNVGPFTCPLFECLPLFTNMLVCQPKSWGDFRDISATVVQ